MKINKIFLLSLISLLPLSACTPPTPPEAPETAIETTNPDDDKYKVSVDVSQIDKNDKNESSGNLENGKNGGDLVNAEETKGDDRPAWEIEESMAESQRAEAEEEESKAYEEYINSDMEEEMYIFFDHEADGFLYFIDIPPEDAEGMSATEYKIDKAGIKGETASLAKGDIARISYNGAIVDNELVKVYAVYNQTKEDEEAEAEEETEEEADELDHEGKSNDEEFLADLKRNNIDINTLPTRHHDGSEENEPDINTDAE